CCAASSSAVSVAAVGTARAVAWVGAGATRLPRSARNSVRASGHVADSTLQRARAWKRESLSFHPFVMAARGWDPQMTDRSEQNVRLGRISGDERIPPIWT